METWGNKSTNHLNKSIKARIEECIDIQTKDLFSYTTIFDKIYLFECYESIEDKSDKLFFNGNSDLFKRFILIVTNFSSTSFTKILTTIIDLIEKSKLSLNSLMDKVKDDKKATIELIDISNIFVKLVSGIRYGANMMHIHLENAVRHLNVVENVLNSNPYKDESTECSNEDKIDLRTALKGLKKGAKNLLRFSKSDKKCWEESRPNQNNIIQTKKETITKLCEEFLAENCNNENASDQKDSGIIHVAYKYGVKPCINVMKSGLSNIQNYFKHQDVGHDVSVDFKAAEFTSDTEESLLCNETGIPPMIGVIGAYVLGDCSLSVINLVRKFWKQKQQNNVYELNALIIGLVQLDAANKNVMHCMAEAEETTHYVLSNIETIQLCLENKREQAENIEICSTAIQLTKLMIKCLQNISQVT